MLTSKVVQRNPPSSCIAKVRRYLPAVSSSTSLSSDEDGYDDDDCDFYVFETQWSVYLK